MTRSWVGPANVPPRSVTLAVRRARRLRARPPTRSRASSTTTEWPGARARGRRSARRSRRRRSRRRRRRRLWRGLVLGRPGARGHAPSTAPAEAAPAVPSRRRREIAGCPWRSLRHRAIFPANPSRYARRLRARVAVARADVLGPGGAGSLASMIGPASLTSSTSSLDHGRSGPPPADELRPSSRTAWARITETSTSPPPCPRGDLSRPRRAARPGRFPGENRTNGGPT